MGYVWFKMVWTNSHNSLSSKKQIEYAHNHSLCYTRYRSCNSSIYRVQRNFLLGVASRTNPGALRVRQCDTFQSRCSSDTRSSDELVLLRPSISCFLDGSFSES